MANKKGEISSMNDVADAIRAVGDARRAAAAAKENFTTTEYMVDNALDGDAHDPVATRLVNKHLRRLGYVQVRKKGKWVWMRPEHTRTDARQALELKLRQLEAGHGKTNSHK